MRDSYKVLVGKLVRRPLRSPRCTWEDSIRMDLRDVGCEGVDCTRLTQDTNGGACVHGNEPSGSIRLGNSLTS